MAAGATHPSARKRVLRQPGRLRATPSAVGGTECRGDGAGRLEVKWSAEAIKIFPSAPGIRLIPATGGLALNQFILIQFLIDKRARFGT
jgi:hypothetical protein